jgi:hypothetical protein
MTKHHAPPPIVFGSRVAAMQGKAAARPEQRQPPPTRYGAPTAAAQAKFATPPPEPRRPSRVPPYVRSRTLQRAQTPFQIGTDSVVTTWDQYKASRNDGEHAKRLRTISGVVLGTGDVVVGTSNWDDREEHQDSVGIFGPALEIGRQEKFGISCGEKDAMLTVLETAFHGNYRPLKGEHERCTGAYFRVIREKLKEHYGTIQGAVSIEGKDVRQQLSYLECCDGCFRMLVQRSTRFYGLPDLVHNQNKHRKNVF